MVDHFEELGPDDANARKSMFRVEHKLIQDFPAANAQIRKLAILALFGDKGEPAVAPEQDAEFQVLYGNAHAALSAILKPHDSDPYDLGLEDWKRD